MQIYIKNKDTLLYDDFKFKCVIGKKGFTSKKIEGDKKTPKGTYNLGPIYFRKDRIPKLQTKLKQISKFDLDFIPEQHEKDQIHVWYATHPMAGLNKEGNVLLIPTKPQSN